jgi:hypothetical protein
MKPRRRLFSCPRCGATATVVDMGKWKGSSLGPLPNAKATPDFSADARRVLDLLAIPECLDCEELMEERKA